LAQQVSTLAMSIPSQCGINYASAAAKNKVFINSIEDSMQQSLDVLKTVVGLITSQEQLTSLIRQVQNSLPLAYEVRFISLANF
jgi:hypothetical protein